MKKKFTRGSTFLLKYYQFISDNSTFVCYIITNGLKVSSDKEKEDWTGIKQVA